MKGLTRRGHVGLRDWGLTRGRHLCPGTTWYLHLRVGRDLLGTVGHWYLLLWVRESMGHLLVGMGQVGLRHRRCWLRGWGCVWMRRLRWSLHGARHHLRVLLGDVARWSLVALGERRLRLIAVVLMWLHVTREPLLVMGRKGMLGGHISMKVALLGLEMRVGAGNSRRPGLVPLRRRMPHGLSVWMFLQLRLGGWSLNGHSWPGHKLGVGAHLWG